ncbi:hypothetical protein, partial [Sneathiella sp.]|uniref:hypothetical protein n=1 Tax=Sneathiella sp. TaxID=1964365 RepID=UPI00260A4A05
MNSLTPFKTPTLYTPKTGANLPVNNALTRTASTPSGPKFYTPNNLRNALNPNNLAPRKVDPNRTQNALAKLFNLDLSGQSPGDTPSTGGDPNQGAGVAQNPSDMSMEGLMSENESLAAFGDVVDVGTGLGATEKRKPKQSI